MGSSELIRWGAIGLMMAGLTWLVLGLAAVLGILQAIPGREDIALLAVALLLTAAGLAGLHTMQGGTRRPPGTGWFLPRPRCNSGSYLGYRSLRGGKLGPRRDLISCHRGHARRVHSIWGGYAAGGSAATLVWTGPHRFHARFVARANVLWDCAVRAVPGGAGLRAVVAEGSRYGAALAREVSSTEKTHPTPLGPHGLAASPAPARAFAGWEPGVSP
jgi:hypothetical protein